MVLLSGFRNCVTSKDLVCKQLKKNRTIRIFFSVESVEFTTQGNAPILTISKVHMQPDFFVLVDIFVTCTWTTVHV